MAKEILDILLELRDGDAPHAVATVVETAGSVSAKTGAKAVIDREGRVLAGWVGGGCAESTTCQAALDSLRSGRSCMIDIDMTDEMLGVGMPCGGSMRVYVEPVLPKPRLWVMGHGRVAECLCAIGDMVGLKVIVNDPGAEQSRFPGAVRIVNDDMEYKELKPTESDFVVIATQHKGDHESMQRALRSGAAYIALIASRKRSNLVMDFLRENGFGPDELDRVRAPAGLDLGAKTPEEIALSVISEIVMTRRRGTGLVMRDKSPSEDSREAGDESPTVAAACH